MQDSDDEGDSLAVPESADRPPCTGCQNSWPVPRRVAYKLMPHVPSHISPTTPETVVAFQTVDRHSEPHFPERVFEDVQYTVTSRLRHRLVRDFQYDDQSGKVTLSNTGNGDSQSRYAQLVTLNSWYRSLFGALMYVSFSVIDVQTNLLMAVRVLYDADLVAHEDSSAIRHAFVASWFGLMILAGVLAVREALWEWEIKASPKQGDLIPACSWIDRWTSFLALVLFALFSVENMVKDIVIVLHPWKSVQPYAALKFENTRSHMVGWKTKSMFNVENRSGAQLTLPVLLATKTLAFLFKLYLCSLFFRIDLVAAAASSVPSIIWGWYRFITLSRNRRSFHAYLVSRLGSPTVEDGERRAMEKMLARHFKQRVNKSAGKSSEKSGVITSKSGALSSTLSRHFTSAGIFSSEKSVIRVSRNEFREDSFKQKELCDSCGRPRGKLSMATPWRRKCYQKGSTSWDVHGRSELPKEARLLLRGISTSDQSVGVASRSFGTARTNSITSESKARQSCDSTSAVSFKPDTSDPDRGRLTCAVPAHLWQMVDQACEEGRGLLLLLDAGPTDEDPSNRESAQTRHTAASSLAPSASESTFCHQATGKYSIGSGSVFEASTTLHAPPYSSADVNSIDFCDSGFSSPTLIVDSDPCPLNGLGSVVPCTSLSLVTET